MRFSWGAQYPTLKTNLRLAMTRLKMFGNKKKEMALKARTEIADYIAIHKEDRARIRAEHIIREDYLVEAYEILEMYCDLLLARFHQIEQMETLDDAIAEAVISILWAAPRVSCDVPEFKTISDQLFLKYGKPFAESARANQLEYPAKVNPRLIQKLGVSTPPKLLVEKYLILIAKSAGVDFVPDPDAMRDDEVSEAEKMLIDFKNAGEAPNPVPMTDNNYTWQILEGVLPVNRRVFPPPVAAASLPASPAFPPTNHPVPGGPRFPPGNKCGEGGIYEFPGTAPQNNLCDQVTGDSTPHRNDSAATSGHAAMALVTAESTKKGARDNKSTWRCRAENAARQPPGFHLPKIGSNGIPGGLDVNYPQLSQRNSLVNDGHNYQGPSAPPQSLKKSDNLDSEIRFRDPSGNLSALPGNDLDFDEIARRFDQLKKKP